MDDYLWSMPCTCGNDFSDNPNDHDGWCIKRQLGTVDSGHQGNHSSGTYGCEVIQEHTAHTLEAQILPPLPPGPAFPWLDEATEVARGMYWPWAQHDVPLDDAHGDDGHRDDGTYHNEATHSHQHSHAERRRFAILGEVTKAKHLSRVEPPPPPPPPAPPLPPAGHAHSQHRGRVRGPSTWAPYSFRTGLPRSRPVPYTPQRSEIATSVSHFWS
jgi:hypothetical protein